MKAIVLSSIYVRDVKEYDVEDLGKHYKVTGFTEDLSDLRSQGALVRRAELDNQPILEGYLGPMWDGGRLRYETQGVYNMLSA